MLVTTQWPLKRGAHLTSLVWVCVLWRPYRLNGAICAMGLFMRDALYHPDDISQYPRSSRWHDVIWTLIHLDELAPGRISPGWLMANGGYHPDDLRCCPMSSGWHKVIRNLNHSDDLAPGCISSGWLMAIAWCHPDDLSCRPMSSRWHNEIWILSHPDDLSPGRTSPGWLIVRRAGLLWLQQDFEWWWSVPLSSASLY